MNISASVTRNGYCLVPDVLDVARCDALCAELQALDGSGVRRRGEMYAIRNLFEASRAIRELARSAAIRALAEAVLGPGCFAVQAVLLDKIPDANWKVPFHQDLYIPLAARPDNAEPPEFSGWSEKAGVVHAKPPAKVLESMVSLRVQLDDCGVGNGPLRVIPGSHREGELTGMAIREWQARIAEVVCVAPRGSVLLLRPLLLHASAPAQEPGHRRVLQLQFTNAELPGGMHWHARV